MLHTKYTQNLCVANLVKAIRNMSFIDCLLMTLFNAAICIGFPKVLSLFSTGKTFTTLLQPVLASQTAAKADFN